MKPQIGQRVFNTAQGAYFLEATVRAYLDHEYVLVETTAGQLYVEHWAVLACYSQAA